MTQRYIKKLYENKKSELSVKKQHENLVKTTFYILSLIVLGIITAIDYAMDVSTINKTV